jgi:phage/plasmid primase-like uncharacterized protein
MKTLDAARGKWRGILLSLGIDEKYLRNKHGPCPLCGITRMDAVRICVANAARGLGCSYCSG